MARPAHNHPHRSGPAQPRILRIGILLGDTFIEEQLVRERKPVTIGQSAKNTFSIPIEKMPRNWPLFDMVDGKYVLKINKRMKGRVAVDGGKPRTISDLKGNEARPTDDYWTLPLSDRSRGKIELGEMKLLFQFVAAPPLQPRPRLPASVRGNLANRIDPRLAMILTISIIVHFGVALWAFQHDQVKQRHAQKRLDDFRRDSYEIRTIDMTQPTISEGEATEANQGDEDKTPKKVANKATVKDDTPGDSGDGGAPDDATLEEMVNNSAALSVLGGAEGSDGRYARSDDVDQGVDLAKQTDDLKQSGRNVSAFGSGDRRSRGPANANIAGEKGGGQIEGVKGGNTAERVKTEEKIKSRVDLRGIDDGGDGTLDPNKVRRKIQSRYKRGLQKCHEQVLKINPRAGGRVQLSFTIGPTGRVTRANARGFDPQVDKCIEAQMRRWRFGTPKDDDGKPATAKFSIPVILKAGT